MRVIITGGGTGGHLSIAKAMLEEFDSRGFECIYIGSLSGQDRSWFDSESRFTKKYFLDTGGVVNKRGFGILKSLFFQFIAFAKVVKIFFSLKPDFVFSVGGYSSAPASLASIVTLTPLFLHEQNSIKGSLNRVLSPFAKYIFGSFDHNDKNYIKTSYPVREEFFINARDRNEVKCVMFLGGSQGAVAINNFALDLALELSKRGIKIIHQCGKLDFERVSGEYKKMGIDNCDVFDFRNDIFSSIKEADLCITRSGASSVWELCASRLPCIYVPYPYAAGNHQYFNALEFTSKGLGFLMPQDEFSIKRVLEIVDGGLGGIDLGDKISNSGCEQIAEKILASLS